MNILEKRWAIIVICHSYSYTLNPLHGKSYTICGEFKTENEAERRLKMMDGGELKQHLSDGVITIIQNYTLQ